MAKNTQKLAGTETAPETVIRPARTGLYKNGREYPDPTPVAPPVGFIKQPTMAETMRDMIRSHALREAARNSGVETFEEADDFDVGDDYDPTSPYEEVFEPPVAGPSPAEEIASAIHRKFTEEAPTPQAPPPAEAKPTPGPSEPTPAQAAPAGGGPISSFFTKK